MNIQGDDFLMSRLNVEHNGKWANFSTIVDGFMTGFMDLRSYVEWRKVQDVGMSPIALRNTITLKEAAENIRNQRTSEETIQLLIEVGISEEESRALIAQIEYENYTPKENEVDGMKTYTCPNCKENVSLGQEECSEKTCSIKFIWSENTVS